jgi:hypothetical protein
MLWESYGNPKGNEKPLYGGFCIKPWKSLVLDLRKNGSIWIHAAYKYQNIAGTKLVKESTGSKSHYAGPTDSATKNPRLPCRGCRRDCKHYRICDGRPWRTLTPENTAVSKYPDWLDFASPNGNLGNWILRSDAFVREEVTSAGESSKLLKKLAQADG